jgi:hypothetical protein
MGLLTSLLTLPVSGPVLGAKWVLERVVDEARRELYDEGAIMQQLAQVAMLAEAGEIADEEHRELEDVLLQRLAAARAAQVEATEGWSDHG